MSFDPQRLKQLFLGAFEIAGSAQRQAWLAEQCGQDPDLLAKVQALLKAREDPESFLDMLAPAPPSPPLRGRGDGGEGVLADRVAATMDEPINEHPGTAIGPYKLLQQIGEGGMGTVFMAEQTQPVQRKVALKIINPGMDSRQVIARFEAERQALALMDHPNIAKVLDAGTTEVRGQKSEDRGQRSEVKDPATSSLTSGLCPLSSGRPYFVMELVKGVSITKYCDDHNLTPRERLELFLPVCHAVQHAHQKGIIHRDLKPSNVLVALYDDKPVPKVIDFGVVKAIGPKLTERTMFTQFGQMVGTLEYMSPEQASFNALDIDTRSDIYSLGVLLYELLTGSTPFEKKRLREAAFDEVVRIIREEEPPKPSTRLSTTQELSSIASHRKTEPAKLGRLIKGDLDWIVMKSLEKDRNRRYETANALAMDVQRYLHDEPVLACPPSASYRLRKFARKYRTLLRIGAAFVLLLVLAAAVSTWQALRASLAKQQALEERDRAKASFRIARDAVDRLFTQVSQSPKLKARGMEKFRKDLLQNAKEFYERFVQEQFDAPGVRYDLGLAYHRLGEIDRQLGDYPATEESLTKAIAVLDELVRAQPDVAEFQRDLAASYAGLGRAHSDTANWEKADTTFQQALAIQEKLVAAHPEAPEYRFALAKTYFEIVLVRRGEHHESALTMAQQVQDILTKLLQEYPKVSEYQVLLAEAQMILGNIYNAKGRHEKQADLANGWFEKAATAFKETQSIYARLVHDQPEAPPEHWQSLAHSHALLGIAYGHLTQTEKQEEELRQALPIYEKLAHEHPDVLEYAFDLGRCHNELGMTAYEAGRPVVALEEYAKAIAIMEELVGKGKRDARIQLSNAQICRACVWARQGEYGRATEQADAMVGQGDLPYLELYNVACVFSLASAAADRNSKLSSLDRNRLKARYADRAMDFLRQSLAKGYPYPRDLKEDHDLDPLRERGDFRKLVADLEAKQKK